MPHGPQGKMNLDNDMRHKFGHGCSTSEFLLLACFRKQHFLCCQYHLFLLWKVIEHISLWEQTLGERGHSFVNFHFSSRMEGARGLLQRGVLQWHEVEERQHNQLTSAADANTHTRCLHYKIVHLPHACKTANEHTQFALNNQLLG